LKEKHNYPKHIILFILTLICTTLAGGEWLFGKSVFASGEHFLTLSHFFRAMEFSVPFLLILTFHEFGHYFMARKYCIPVTLPYYIPGWLGFLGIPSIGTFGAVIRIKGAIQSTKEYFDVGIAGPLAGFVIAVAVLWYGFVSLPPAEFIYEIHPEYKEYGLDYADHVYNAETRAEEGALIFKLGPNLLFSLFEKLFADPERVPNYYEIIHYPWLFAGYLALFFTAINLLPIGQLDGGHVIYGLFGHKRHGIISSALFLVLLFWSGLGLIMPHEPVMDLLWGIPLYLGFLFICLSSMFPDVRSKIMVALIIFSVQFLVVWISPNVQGYSGWLLYCLLLGRFLGIHHPPTYFSAELDTKRKVLGWVALAIFILCFSPQPFLFD
jgi:membrane-associated protease RseP (regulator of RpoE activity)